MKHQLDFEIYSRGNPKSLILVDLSEYFENPDNLIYEIQFPSISKVYNIYADPKITALTTKKINYSTGIIDFPDGLYNIRMSTTPNKKIFKCKNYLKLDKVNNRINNLLQEDCLDIKEIDYLYELDKYFRTAQALENTNPQKSIELFQIGLKKLNKIENCDGL